MMNEARSWYDRRLKAGEVVYLVQDQHVHDLERQPTVRVGRLAILRIGSYPGQYVDMRVDFLDTEAWQSHRASGVAGVSSMAVFTEHELLFTLASDMGLALTRHNTPKKVLADDDLHHRLATTLVELVDRRRHSALGEPLVTALSQAE